jgi:hypothetical protein
VTDPFRPLRPPFASDHATADTDVWTLQLALGHASLRTGITSECGSGGWPTNPPLSPSLEQGEEETLEHLWRKSIGILQGLGNAPSQHGRSQGDSNPPCRRERAYR